MYGQPETEPPNTIGTGSDVIKQLTTKRIPQDVWQGVIVKVFTIPRQATKAACEGETTVSTRNPAGL